MEIASIGKTTVVFRGVSHEIPIYQRELLPPERPFEGPALVEEDGSSTVVPPGWSVVLDQVGCLVLNRS
jgi:N-methylhydantoinase A